MILYWKEKVSQSLQHPGNHTLPDPYPMPTCPPILRLNLWWSDVNFCKGCPRSLRWISCAGRILCKLGTSECLCERSSGATSMPQLHELSRTAILDLSKKIPTTSVPPHLTWRWEKYVEDFFWNSMLHPTRSLPEACSLLEDFPSSKLFQELSTLPANLGQRTLPS